MVLVSRDNERAPFSPFYPVSSCLFVSPLPRRIHWERTVLLRVCRIDGTCSFLRRDLPENGIFHSIFSFSFFLRSFFKNFPFRSQTCIRRLTSRIKRLWRFFFYFSVDFACEKSRRKKVKNEKKEITILSPLTRITCNSKLKFTPFTERLYIYIYISSILGRHFEEFSCTRFPFPQQRYMSRGWIESRGRRPDSRACGRSRGGILRVTRAFPQVTTVCIRVCREFRREGLSEFIRRICNNVYSSSRERGCFAFMCACVRVYVSPVCVWLYHMMRTRVTVCEVTLRDRL